MKALNCELLFFLKSQLAQEDEILACTPVPDLETEPGSLTEPTGLLIGHAHLAPARFHYVLI